VIPTKVASTEWQWLEFHVSMPRTFFIDSPGDLCGGQHLCAGASTNAWSYVGIAPGASGSSVGAANAPTVVGGSGPTGGQGTGTGGGGPPIGLILGTTVVLGAGALGATALAARRNPMGMSAETLGRIGNIISGMRGSTGKSGGGTTGKGGTGKGGTTTGKGGGMSQIDVTALGQQLSQMSQPTQTASPPPAASGTPEGGGSPPAPPPPVTPAPPP
jgi:hypothetical protein